MEPAQGRRGEQGAALLVALLAAVFLTILGLVLLEILKGGLAQAASTEASIQAEALAQRGIDDATALVWNEVAKSNALTAATPSDTYRVRIETIENALGQKDPDPNKREWTKGSLLDKLDGLTVTGERGTYTIEIVADTDNYNDYVNNRAAINDYPYSRILTVQVTATAGTTRKRTATKQADIHVTTINPVFKYPLSAKTDLTLSGSPYIVGDVLARTGNLYVFNKAYFVGSPGTQYTMETNWPTVKGFYKALAVERKDPQGNESIPPEGVKFSHFEPFMDVQLPNDPDIPVADAVAAWIGKMNDDLANPLLFQEIDDEVFGGYIIDSDVTISKKYAGQWVTFPNAEVTIADGSNVVQLAVEDGVLTMTPGARVSIPKGSLYVKYDNDFIAAATFAGSLEVAPPYAVVVQGNVVIEDGFHFKGNMFVDGSVQIIGSVNLEGTLYVSGDVDMKDMKSINSMDTDNDGEADMQTAPLILLAGGQVIFSESQSDEPIRIRAYLYSQQPMKLYGVVSKLHITGGVHGETVTLNALREDRNNKQAFWFGTEPDPFYFTPSDAQKNLPPESSNLQIFYDPALFSQPPVGIPVTQELTMFVQSTLPAATTP